MIPLKTISDVWVNDYIGLRWTRHGCSRGEGVSCLGLRNLIYKELFDIDLPQYGATVDSNERMEITSIIENRHLLSRWRMIDPADVQPFDVVTFQLRRLEAHLGVVCERGRMIHVCEGQTSQVARFNTEPWASLRPRFYRYDFRTLPAVPAISSYTGPFVVAGLGTNSFDAAITVPEGTTILQAIELAFPRLTETALNDIRVTVGTDVVLREYWKSCRPKLWDKVIIRVVPSSSNLLKIILSLVVVIAAAAVSGGLLGPAAAGLSIGGMTGWLAAGSVSAAVLGAAVATGGMLLVNALIPVPKPGKDLPEIPSYNISGWSNALNADGAVPSVLGQLRYSPPFAAIPYNMNIGNFRFARAILLLGYGPMEISDLWIGNTPIENFIGVTTEIRQGYDTDAPVTLYPTQVIEDADNPLDLPNAVGLQRRISAVNITAFECEFYFAGGLIAYDQNAHPQVAAVQFTINYRLAGSGTTLTVPFVVPGFNTQPIYRAIRIEVATRGQYEVTVSRLSPDWDDIIQYLYQNVRFVSRSSWSALRSFRPEYPLNYRKPMALIAIQIQATAQLGGTIQGVSCMARRICKDYDSATSTWIERATSNPASLTRYVLQGPENAFPRTDAMLDLDDFVSWHGYCVSKSLNFNAAYTGEQAQDQVLDDVSSAGRAMKHDRGDKYSIIVDNPRATFTAHITPENSSDFTLTNPKLTFPDAFAVNFLDETNSFAQARRVIPWPTFGGTPSVIQDLPLPGKTNPDEIWIETRRRQFEAVLRLNSYTLTMDMEHLTAYRGDGVRVTHHVLDQRQMGGYVVAKSADSRTVKLENLVTMEVAQDYQCRFRHDDGTSFITDIINVPGTTSSITLLNLSDGTPQVGDLAMFGVLNASELEAIIKSIEPGEGTTAHLNLIPSASTLDALADAETPPTWDGIIGNDIGFVLGTPGVPVITNISSGQAAQQFVGSSNATPIVVFMAPTGGVPATSFQVQHRLHGTSTWTTMAAFAAAVGAQVIGGYNLNDNIDVQVRASNGINVSAWSATAQHVVGSPDFLIDTLSAFSASFSGGTWTFTWTVATRTSGLSYKTNTGVMVYWAEGTGQPQGSLSQLFDSPAASSPATWGNPPENTTVGHTFGARVVATDGTVGDMRTFDIATH